MRRAVSLIIITAALLLSQAAAMEEERASGRVEKDLDAAIFHLLEYVRTSDVVFIRNGKEHTAREAADHIEKKYNHYRKKIKTPEDFIEYSATKSMMSGKPYRIRLEDGSVIATREWLIAELERYRSAGAAARPDTLEGAGKCERDSLR